MGIRHATPAPAPMRSTRSSPREPEFADGIGRLWARTDLPDAAAPTMSPGRACNPDGALRLYPGSPSSRCSSCAPQDRLRLLELHTHRAEGAGRALRQRPARSVQVTAGDGFAGLQAALPPPSRRGAGADRSVLRDPRRLRGRASRRSPTRCSASPPAPTPSGIRSSQRRESERLPETLERIAAGDWLHVALTVRAPPDDGFGLHGSGMFVFNPPWKLGTPRSSPCCRCSRGSWRWTSAPSSRCTRVRPDPQYPLPDLGTR